MIHHGLVTAGIHARPPNQIGRLGIPVPLLVFQEFLTHEELRYSRSSEQKTGGKSRAAASVPGARVRTIGQSGNSWVASYGYEGVVFDAGEGLPGVWEALGIEIVGDGVEIHKSALALRGLLDCGANGAAQS